MTHAVMLGTAAAVLFGAPAGGAIDPVLADRYFQEAKRLSGRDAGSLWGMELYGPMLFVEPSSRRAVANQADSKGHLEPEGEVFVGAIPANLPVANTAVEWGGVRWTMILWPVPADERARASLMMHECFHRIQDSVGLAASEGGNDHLDSARGRYLLQLEWRALAEALRLEGEARRSALVDALAFRRARHQAFASQKEGELALEMNEGLAEYTGVTLAAYSDEQLRDRLIETLAGGSARPTFVRSFAYISGPAYGALLDERDPAWRRGLTPTTDLGGLAARAWGVLIEETPSAEVESRAGRYDGAALWREEAERDRRRQQRLDRLRERFLSGPVLHLRLRSPRTSFDPNTLFPLAGVGTVYPTLTLSDRWGVLTVIGGRGALLYEDWSAVRVSGPFERSGRELSGDGWVLELAEGSTLTTEDGSDVVTVRPKANAP